MAAPSGSTRAPTPTRPARARRPDPSEPAYKSAELVQRARMVLDVAAADLEAAEAALGAFHETTWYFRHALAEARRSWERLRAEVGSRAIEQALAAPPLLVLTLGDPASPRVLLLPIAGSTYRVERLAGSDLAPTLWRLTRLLEPAADPYYLARLRDGTTQCDCAEWTYRVAETPDAPPCKHLDALQSLGWL